MEQFNCYTGLWSVLFSLNLFYSTCTPFRLVSSEEVLVNSETFDIICPPEKNIYVIAYSVIISNATFYGSKQTDNDRIIHGLRPEQWDRFKEVFHIHGNLTVTASHPEFTSLNFFRNIKSVYNLTITNTSLLQLNLLGLENVKHSVVIEHNRNLCVNQSEEFWQYIMSNEEGVLRIGDNKPEDQCDTRCDQECVQELGCWGSGPDQCRKCRHVIMSLNNTCVNSCDEKTYFKVRKECWPCHEECEGGCSSDEPRFCKNCKHVRRGADCVSECFHGEYIRDGVCTPCHENCSMYGCTGPLGYKVEGGCNTCEKIVFALDQRNDYYTQLDLPSVKNCLSLNDSCPEGFFEETVPHDALGYFAKLRLEPVCWGCHYLCLKCTSYGFDQNVCQECISDYKDCICPLDHFLVQEPGDIDCYPCDTGCKECKDEDTCVDCHDNLYRVYTELVPRSQAPFYCAEKCPDNQPFPLFSNLYQNYCFSINLTWLGDNKNENGLKFIYLALPIGICLLLFVVSIRVFNTANGCNSKPILEEFEEDPLTANIALDIAPLQFIEESNLKITEVIKKGYFSTVHKGLFYLDTKNTQVSVAIIEFNQHNNRTLTDEVLKEANFLCSLNHPQLLRLLGVCVTSKLTLVTQFFPLGDMLHYLRSNKTKIKPSTLISWSKQIAMGMDYLEKQYYVHGRLAAKKVLVQTVNQVRVSCFRKERFTYTDQGLFASNVKSYHFQWLALESLKQGIFTHKSDVWSFGVVLWEILTYGQFPYRESSLSELIPSLEGGHRLKQPDSCSADTYSVLATCWVEEASARPSFQELVDTLSKMAREPSHFIFVSKRNNSSTVPDLPPRDHSSEIDEEDDSDISVSNHDYVNTNAITTAGLDLDHPSTSLVTSQPLHTYINSSFDVSNLWYAEIRSIPESCDEITLENLHS